MIWMHMHAVPRKAPVAIVRPGKEKCQANDRKLPADRFKGAPFSGRPGPYQGPTSAWKLVNKSVARAGKVGIGGRPFRAGSFSTK